MRRLAPTKLIVCAIAIAVSIQGIPLNIAKAQNPEPFSKGHIIAGISDGRLQHYDSNGTLLETISTQQGPGANTTGCAFDSAGNLYVTTFNEGNVLKFKGPGLPHVSLGQFGERYDGSTESIVFAANGYVYVGSVAGDNDIRKFDPTGSLVTKFDVEIEDRGADWIDLAQDQRTMYYTSEGTRILRYDVVSDEQLTDFAPILPGTHAYALRVLPNNEVLVADSEFVLRLNSFGQEIKRYDVGGQDFWFSLNLDPDGTSFWAGDFTTGKFFKFDIENGGAPLNSVDTGAGEGKLFGICVAGEITSGQLDTDGDGIPDDIETSGYDFDNNGTIDVDLAALGAKSDHKDVFVQIDWIEQSGLLGHSHKPGDDSIDLIKQAFANAPVTNPDGAPGINLHVVFGQKIEEDTQNKELGTVDTNCDYAWKEFEQLKDTNLPREKWSVFHYVIFGHDLPSFSCIGGRPSGISRNGTTFADGASDFIVTLGGFWEGLLVEGGIKNARAGTFMHELGHNLGLGHGGLVLDANGNVVDADHTGYKPNHLSVMNYSFQTRGLRKKSGILGFYSDGNFDYSRFGPTDLPDLNEPNLSEPTGLGASDQVKDFGTRYYCQSSERTQTVDGLQQAVDWNCNGTITETVVATSINKGTEQTVLHVVNEWEHLRFKGGAVGAFGTPIELPEQTSMQIAPEITFQQDSEIAPLEMKQQFLYLPLITRN